MQNINIDQVNLNFVQQKSYEHGKEYGCIIGALIGDSTGSFHEFSMETISEEEMKTCMEMPGGGPFGVGPG